MVVSSRKLSKVPPRIASADSGPATRQASGTSACSSTAFGASTCSLPLHVRSVMFATTSPVIADDAATEVDRRDRRGLRVGDDARPTRDAAEQRQVDRVAGDRRFDLGIAIRAAERHRRVDAAVHVEHDVGDREAQRRGAARRLPRRR